MSSKRVRVLTGSPWEPIVGYCRAVKVGHVIEVSGTTAMKEGQVLHPNDPYGQMKACLAIIENALAAPSYSIV